MSTDATEIFQEGMIYPGVKLISKGEPIQSVFDILTANCRMPDFLTGDLWAGVASARVGERRVLEIIQKYGKDVFLYALSPRRALANGASWKSSKNMARMFSSMPWKTT